MLNFISLTKMEATTKHLYNAPNISKAVFYTHVHIFCELKFNAVYHEIGLHELGNVTSIVSFVWVW